MFCHAVATARRPVVKRSGRVFERVRRKTTSAASAAISLAPATAIPTLAAARAGASLMPSPAMATDARGLHSRMRSSFSSGSRSAATSSMPASRAMASAARRRSPVSIARWPMPMARSGGAGGHAFANAVAQQHRANYAAALGRPHRGGARASASAAMAAEGGSFSSETNAALPARTVPAAVRASTPRPGRTVAPSTAGASTPRRCASSTMMRASG